MNLDLSTDYLVFDDLEPITLITDIAPQDGAEAGQPIASALRRNPSKRELSASNGAYTGQDVVWEIPAVLVTGTIKPGDMIQQADQTQFTVLETSLDAVNSIWHCMARDMAIVWGLRDTINIEQSGITYDADGAAVRAWPTNSTNVGGTTQYAALVCKVQLEDADVQSLRGVRGQARKWTIFLSKQILIDVRECRVVWTDVAGRQGPAGKTYYFDLDNYQQAERIDQLPILLAHESPDAVPI